MNLKDKLKILRRKLKQVLYLGSGALFVTYHINQTLRSVNKIVNTSVLDSEKKYSPEYIYIEDPSYGINLRLEQDKQTRSSVSLFGILKGLKHTLAWRLLWLCRHGNKEQRNIALDQLAAFKNNKQWDCLKLAQAMDKQTAVLLARTRGADLRYFLPPPIHVRRAALTSELLSYKFRDMIIAVQDVYDHICIQHFLSKYFTNLQDHPMETDSIASKPGNTSERDLVLLCLDALHHHISLYYEKEYADDQSICTLVDLGLLPALAETFLRYPSDSDIDYAVLRILTVLSLHCDLLKGFFENGLIGELSRLLKSKDVRLASSAAVALTNLSGEYRYLPGLYLLHPLYRTRTPHECDTLLVHGLRGGVFVTWRQRDKKCAEPVGLIEVTIADNDCDPCDDVPPKTFIDPELKQVMEDLKELDELSLLSDFEIVLHDIPIASMRESNEMNFTATNRYSALLQENQDRCNYTHCWPKDWLPKDCDNLRILGVNYWSSLSEWLERCPLQTAEISVRADALAPILLDAGVGQGDVPVVWLTHSMGGLIVKQMLTEAAKSEATELQKLCKSTKAVFFYSTPHKGSAMATMPRPAAAVLWPSNDVRQLQENSPVLLKLHEEFIKYSEIYQWETVSFVETLPTLVTAFKVPIHFVETASADAGRGVLYQLPLDHLSICKPATRQSILYTAVLDVIQRVTSKNVELKYSIPFVQWFINWLWSIFSANANKVTNVIDESHTTNDGLKWFEKILLDTFTDF